MWALILAGIAQAAPWTAQPLWTGTDLVADTGEVAVGVAIAGWSPMRRLYVVIERQTPNGLSRTHHLDLAVLDCPGGWGAPCDPLQIEPIGLPQDDVYNLPALVLEPPSDPLGEPTVHVVRSVRREGCGAPVRALEEWVRDPVAGWSSHVIHEPAACGDAQLSHAALADDVVWACWTVDPAGPGFDDNLWCGTRALGGAVDTGHTGDTAAVGGWTTAGLANGLRTQDHGWFVVDGGERFLVHRDRDPVPAVPRLQGPGVGGALPLSHGGLHADFPSIAQAPDGSLHAAWVEGRKRVAYARCVAGDCADPLSWQVQPRPVRFRAPGTVEHPEIAIAANGRRFVVWSEDHDPAHTEARRVHLKEMCPTDVMFTIGASPGQELLPLGVSPLDQTLLIGRPHVWIDDATSTVHVVFLEKDVPGQDPLHGDVYWAHSPFGPCP